jgi:precorrin-2 methylase
MIGVGCGDTDLISLEAISYTARADALVGIFITTMTYYY